MIRENHNDRALFNRIAENDEAAFQEVFHSYNKTLFPFIRSLVRSEEKAKEIIQDTFLKLWLNRGTLKEIENPGGWLHTIAVNTAYFFLRTEARYASKLLSLVDNAPPGMRNTYEQFDSRELKSMIAKAIEQLPLRRRQVFLMSRIDGYSRREIARLLHISENTVRNQLGDAIRFLQDYIRENGAPYLPVLLLMVKFLK